ncbi:MAG: ATP-binding protein, partial [Pirellulales bacterium]
TPRRLRDLAQHRESLDDFRNRWERGRNDLTQRRRQYEAMARRIHQLATDVGLASDGMSAGDVLRKLQQIWNRQKPRMARCRKLRRHIQRLQRRLTQRMRGWRKLTRELDQLLSQAGVAHIEEYRRMALETSRVERLRHERSEISREIAAALEECGRAADVEELLAANQVDSLSIRHQQANDELASYQQQLKEQATKLGAIRHQLGELADDRRREEKILELSAIETELGEAATRWQTHTVTWLLLDSVRDEYQRTRQPETLVEASEYLRRLTDGRYLRVWTPLDEALLYVDDAEGQTLSVEVLSRGTREQLFLSLRLALIAFYARRHVRLPVVLDDVLVNFDVGRAEAAAKLLRDFARDGHQLLVFTCHQHVWEMFQSMQVDTRRLPSRIDRQPANTTAIQAGKPFLLDQHEDDLQLVVEEPDAELESDPLDFWTADTDQQLDGEFVAAEEPVDEEESPVEVEHEAQLDVADEQVIDQPAPMPPPEEPAIDVNALLAAEAAIDPVAEEPFEIFPPIVESAEEPDSPHDPNGRPRRESEVIISGNWVRIGETVRRREMLPEKLRRNRQQRSQRTRGDDLGAHAA